MPPATAVYGRFGDPVENPAGHSRLGGRFFQPGGYFWSPLGWGRQRRWWWAVNFLTCWQKNTPCFAYSNILIEDSPFGFSLLFLYLRLYKTTKTVQTVFWIRGLNMRSSFLMLRYTFCRSAINTTKIISKIKKIPQKYSSMRKKRIFCFFITIHL